MKQTIGIETGMLPLVHKYNTILLGLLFAASWYFFSWPLAVSVLIGGLLASTSFALLSRDVRKIMDSLAGAGADRKANLKSVKKVAKVRLLFNFYLRLGVIALILYVLNARLQMNMIGLAVGLSTVMFSIIVVGLSKGNLPYSAQRVKGA